MSYLSGPGDPHIQFY